MYSSLNHYLSTGIDGWHLPLCFNLESDDIQRPFVSRLLPCELPVFGLNDQVAVQRQTFFSSVLLSLPEIHGFVQFGVSTVFSGH